MTSRSPLRSTLLVVAPAALLALGAGCARPPLSGDADSTASPRRDAQQGATGTPSRSDLERLEREARALAKVEGCEQSGQCRTAPVGSRACGGPRSYLPYCPLTTDSAALFSKLDELARAESEFNRRSGMVSTCEFRMPPGVEVVGGQCVAGGGAARVP